MFGKLGFDEVLKGIQAGKEFFIPTGGMGITAENVNPGSKVAKAGLGDFFRNAKMRNRKQNPIAPGLADYVNWVLYDRITFGQSVVVPGLTRLFVLPIGTGGKTKVDTNLEQVSTLTAPQWFNCTGVSVYFAPNAAPIDYANFMATEYLEFWVSSKVYAEGPLDVFPGSGGLVSGGWGTVAAAATTYETNSSNGWPSIHNMYDVRLPAGLNLGKNSDGADVVSDGIIGITILQSQTFTVKLNADGGGATMAVTAAIPIVGIGLTVSVRLHGILSRGVQ